MKSHVNFAGFVAHATMLSALAMGSSFAQTGAAMLRIDCSGNSLGAEVYVDGQFRGECPVDVQVQEGSRRLRFYKKVDQRREQVQEQELRLGAATVKRIEVLLPDPQLTAEAKREEDERNLRLKAIADEKKQQEFALAEAKRMEVLRLEEEIKKRDESQFLVDFENAKSGHADSQFLVGVKYRYGIGVAFNETESRVWLQAAANAGHIAAEILQHGSQLPQSLRDNPKELRLIYENIIEFSQLQKMVKTDATDLQIESNLRKYPIFDVRYIKSSPWIAHPTDQQYYMGGMVTVLEEGKIGQIFAKTKYQRKLEKILSIYGDTDKNIFYQQGFFGAKVIYSDTIESRSIESRSILNLICKPKSSSAEGPPIEFHCLTSYTLLSSNVTRIARFKTAYKDATYVKLQDNPYSILSIYQNGFPY